MSITTSQSPKKSVVKKAFSIKTTNMHPKIGMLFYLSSLTWWFVAVNPATSGLKTVNMALGFFVLLLNFIIGYQAYFHYVKPSSRLNTTYSTAYLGWQILVTIIVENFYFDYEFKGRELLLLILCIFTALLLFYNLLDFKKVLAIILFTPELGGNVVLSWNMASKIIFIFGNSIFYCIGIYFVAKIWLIDKNLWLNYPDQSYVFSFFWHTMINYGLLNVLNASLFQKNYLNKSQYYIMSNGLGVFSVLIYVVFTYGKQTIIFW